MKRLLQAIAVAAALSKIGLAARHSARSGLSISEITSGLNSRPSQSWTVMVEARRRKIKLLILPTLEAIEEMKQHPDDTNAVLHVTC